MAQSWLFLLLWLLESLVASTDSNSGAEADSVCPKQCVCKWKRGKESIFCSQAGFYQVPKLHYTGTQVNTLLKVWYIARKVDRMLSKNRSNIVRCLIHGRHAQVFGQIFEQMFCQMIDRQGFGDRNYNVY